MRYVDCLRTVKLLPDAFPQKGEYLHALDTDIALASDGARSLFMDKVDAEWRQARAAIRALYVPTEDPDYLAYHKVRVERGAVDAYYWIKARRAQVARTQDQLETQRRTAERAQEIWLTVRGSAQDLSPQNGT